MTDLERNLTNCEICERANDCIHKGAFRRLPRTEGGLGLCENLKIQADTSSLWKQEKQELSRGRYRIDVFKNDVLQQQIYDNGSYESIRKFYENRYPNAELVVIKIGKEVKTMPKKYEFQEHNFKVSGEKEDLIYLAELLRDAEGTLGDLRYQIELEFDIDGIRTEIEE